MKLYKYLFLNWHKFVTCAWKTTTDSWFLMPSHLNRHSLQTSASGEKGEFHPDYMLADGSIDENLRM